GDDPWKTGREWIIAHESELGSRWLVDLGSGAAILGGELRDRSARRQVIAADYSPYACESVAIDAEGRLRAVHANLYRNHVLSMPKDAGITGSFDLVSNHLLDNLGEHGRPQAMRLIRMALRSG